MNDCLICHKEIEEGCNYCKECRQLGDGDF